MLIMVIFFQLFRASLKNMLPWMELITKPDLACLLHAQAISTLMDSLLEIKEELR